MSSSHTRQGWKRQIQPPTSTQSSTGPHAIASASTTEPAPISQDVLPAAEATTAETSSIPPAMISTMSSVPYFTPAQLEGLYARQRGGRVSNAKWQTSRIMATGFLQATASRLGFPQRTIATSQQIYQRFHLFYPPSEFVLHEVAVTALFVAAKLNDTPKKARDILLASYALRFPQLVKGASSDTAQPSGSSSKEPDSQDGRAFMSYMAIGNVSESDIDPNILETDRKRLMSLEKLVLETLCFSFQLRSQVALKMVIKLGRVNQLPKPFVRTAWKVAADMHRTSTPLQYPPNVIAAASLYAAALIARPPQASNGTPVQATDDRDSIASFVHKFCQASLPSPQDGGSLFEVERDCHVFVEDVEEAVHELLDLYLTCVSQLPVSIYMSSPGGLATPSPHSPADNLEFTTTSPSSSTGISETSMQQGAMARRKLKQYEYAPPPFAFVDWLNSTRCSHLSEKGTDKPQAIDQTTTPSPAPLPPTAESTGAAKVSAPQVSDPTLPSKEFSALLTDIKIYLRGIEFARQKADEATLASLGIAASVDVKRPLPTTTPTIAEPAPAATSEPLPATSVSIALQSVATRGPFDGSSLRASDRSALDRIIRRKLVVGLRSIFIEPAITLQPDAKVGQVAQNGSTNDHDKATNAPPQKRVRIEHATRYLF